MGAPYLQISVSADAKSVAGRPQRTSCMSPEGTSGLLWRFLVSSRRSSEAHCGFNYPWILVSTGGPPQVPRAHGTVENAPTQTYAQSICSSSFGCCSGSLEVRSLHWGCCCICVWKEREEHRGAHSQPLRSLQLMRFLFELLINVL